MFQEPVHTYCQAGFSSSLKITKGACTACTTALLRKWGSKVTREVASTAAGVRPSPGAATDDISRACGESDRLGSSDMAAPGDGRTPAQRFGINWSVAFKPLHRARDRRLGNSRRALHVS